jgi:hypothetical protein
MKNYKNRLEVHQVNCFYNYTAGLDTTDISLVKAGMKLLKSGLANTICFSDLKCIYLDENRKPQVEWIRPQGHQPDKQWSVEFSKDLPPNIATQIAMFVEFSFHEQHIEGAESKRTPPFFRAALPPIFLENEDYALTIAPSVKLFTDGVMIVSFQLDTTWEGLKEKYLISDLVNIFNVGFNRIWVHADIQRLDAEQLIPNAFEYEFSIGGESILKRGVNKTIKKMREDSRRTLNESLAKEGARFEYWDTVWTLHQIIGTEDLDDWKGTFELCRSIYINVLADLFKTDKSKTETQEALIWEGRPSLSLMRFNDQPNNKKELIEKFGPSMSRILMRAPEIEPPPDLPPDLRLFDDFCFHANRSILLWTWLRPVGAPEDAWDDTNTKAMVLANQCRAEHFEYHNMRIARAYEIAKSPPSDIALINAYEVLATSRGTIHHSSQAGEITDSIEYLLETAGTLSLIESGKEQARWHLDEIRYRSDKRRAKVDSWLAVVFGFVGVSGFAELVVSPLMPVIAPSITEAFRGLVAFTISAALVLLITFLALFTIKIVRDL